MNIDASMTAAIRRTERVQIQCERKRKLDGSGSSALKKSGEEAKVISGWVTNKRVQTIRDRPISQWTPTSA